MFAPDPITKLLARLGSEQHRQIARNSIECAVRNGWQNFRFVFDDAPMTSLTPNESPMLEDLIGDKPNGGWGFLSVYWD